MSFSSWRGVRCARLETLVQMRVREVREPEWIQEVRRERLWVKRRVVERVLGGGRGGMTPSRGGERTEDRWSLLCFQRRLWVSAWICLQVRRKERRIAQPPSEVGERIL